MPETRLTVELADGVPVVATPDEIDITNAGELQAALLDAAARGPGVFVADLSRTQFCDSSGMRALARVHQHAHAEGSELLLVVPTAPVLRVLGLLGLDRVIPNFASLEEALAQAIARPSATPSATVAQP